MKFFDTNSRIVKLTTIGAACAMLAAAAGILADTASKDIVMPFQDVKFSPLKPLGTSTAGGASLWTESPAGARSLLIKFTRGSTEKHYHTFDYQLVVIKGTVTHWTDGMPEAGTKQLGPGSYWYQPARGIHQDTCLVDECIMFMSSFANGETHIVPDAAK